jgi:hypothetical protein
MNLAPKRTHELLKRRRTILKITERRLPLAELLTIQDPPLELTVTQMTGVPMMSLIHPMIVTPTHLPRRAFMAVAEKSTILQSPEIRKTGRTVQVTLITHQLRLEGNGLSDMTMAAPHRHTPNGRLRTAIEPLLMNKTTGLALLMSAAIAGSRTVILIGILQGGTEKNDAMIRSRPGGGTGTHVAVTATGRDGMNPIGCPPHAVKILIALQMTVHGNLLPHGNLRVGVTHTVNETNMQEPTPTRI